MNDLKVNYSPLLLDIVGSECRFGQTTSEKLFSSLAFRNNHNGVCVSVCVIMKNVLLL